MKIDDQVKVKSGRLKGSAGILLDLIADEGVAYYRVRLSDVSYEAYNRCHRPGDEVDLEIHELEVVPSAVL